MDCSLIETPKLVIVETPKLGVYTITKTHSLCAVQIVMK